MKEKRIELPNVERLQSLFTYDDGKLYWKEKPKRSRVNIDYQAGGINNHGYMRVKIDGVSYATHRIIWKMLNNKEPPEHIDHINQNKLDNRIENLREVTQSQNQLNNKARGCSFHKARCKWEARIRINSKLISLGYFNTEEEAHFAYQNAKCKVCQ
jgi:hypothetical protein